MFKRFTKATACAAVLCTTLLAACGDSKTTYTVTCPWAPSGVAALVSQKAASLSTTYSQDTILVAEAIKGDTATANTWVLDKKANDPNLIFANEGMLSITPIIDPKKARFSAKDFAYVQNLYSATFVLSTTAKDNADIKDIKSLQEYVKNGNKVTIAVNGATSPEAFLAIALFNSMGISKDNFKLTPYNSAAEAAQAVAKGETNFAISHQSQILESSQQGAVNVIAAFDKEPLAKGPFAGLEGVGQYGYPYYKNTCLIMARAGTDAAAIKKLNELYGKILNDKDMKSWMEETMMIEIDPLTQEEVDAHLANVKAIVEKYQDYLK